MAEVAAGAPDAELRLHLVPTALLAAVIGAGIALAAVHSALDLLVAVALLQALVAFGWVLGTGMPGRKGGLVIAALAAAGSDVAVSVSPHSRLGALVAVVGLAVPVMFVHQLTRGAARTRVVASLSAVGSLVVLVVAPAALVQLRHEFSDPSEGGRVVAAVVAAIAVALVAGCLVDLVIPLPRFDPHVPRGLLSIVASAVVGSVLAALIVRGHASFADGRGAFSGAALGGVAALLAIATAFVFFTTPEPTGRFGRVARPVLAATVPLSLLAPAAFLLCLAIRT